MSVQQDLEYLNHYPYGKICDTFCKYCDISTQQCAGGDFCDCEAHCDALKVREEQLQSQKRTNSNILLDRALKKRDLKVDEAGSVNLEDKETQSPIDVILSSGSATVSSHAVVDNPKEEVDEDSGLNKKTETSEEYIKDSYEKTYENIKTSSENINQLLDSLLIKSKEDMETFKLKSIHNEVQTIPFGYKQNDRNGEVVFMNNNLKLFHRVGTVLSLSENDIFLKLPDITNKISSRMKIDMKGVYDKNTIAVVNLGSGKLVVKPGLLDNQEKFQLQLNNNKGQVYRVILNPGEKYYFHKSKKFWKVYSD
jgi:hypothetical protein